MTDPDPRWLELAKRWLTMPNPHELVPYLAQDIARVGDIRYAEGVREGLERAAAACDKVAAIHNPDRDDCEPEDAEVRQGAVFGAEHCRDHILGLASSIRALAGGEGK